MQFIIIDQKNRFPDSGRSEAYLRIDHWNDYSFVTMFDVILFDENGRKFELGSVKIGFRGQKTEISTYLTLDKRFTSLDQRYFSVGQDVPYYQLLGSEASEQTRRAYLEGLQDVVFKGNDISELQTEEVFRVSLLRSLSATVIQGQFRRVLEGGVALTDYDFTFIRPPKPDTAGVALDFKVSANSQPSTNIHAVTGRNGVGKTTLLNEMISAVVSPTQTTSGFVTKSIFGTTSVPQGYFSSLISIAFSAFDPFNPPPENSDPGLGTRYSYIGLKDIEDDSGVLLKSLATLRQECVASLGECFSQSGKRERWASAIATLQSDENFARMELLRLLELQPDAVKTAATGLVERMSSGHAVVLLTLSRLVSRVEEKTLILIDEPESHLHPPLLSAFTRALSELLHNRNGLAIVATHSPVLLQEVPRNCVQVLTRSRLSMSADRPKIETFGENVGTLTREVFGLEVARSGFHALLQANVNRGGSYEEILASYNDQLGQEARGILRAMVVDRDHPETMP